MNARWGTGGRTCKVHVGDHQLFVLPVASSKTLPRNYMSVWQLLTGFGDGQQWLASVAVPGLPILDLNWSTRSK